VANVRYIPRPNIYFHRHRRVLALAPLAYWLRRRRKQADTSGFNFTDPDSGLNL
jgi:hypothetical protein